MFQMSLPTLDTEGNHQNRHQALAKVIYFDSGFLRVLISYSVGFGLGWDFWGVL